MISMSRRRVYLGEFNVLMHGATYLPLVSGLLRARAERSEVVRETFEFAPFLFHRDRVDRLAARYEHPAVAAFSMLMWNARLSLAVADRVKRRWPGCLVVVGGASVPHEPSGMLARHRCIDVAVRGEGEDAFAEILERIAVGGEHGAVDLDGIAGVTWRTPEGEVRRCADERSLQRDLDVYPSPYLEGLFEELIATHPGLELQAILETNRGCPFRCTFCYWGKGGLSRKYRFHSLERVRAEIEWMAEHRIRYVFNADSNFGMHRRDLEIAEMLVETKARTGYPEKFRTCYGKNTDDKIFAIGKLLHEHGLEKGITISYQSVDEGVQANIQRSNIKLECARELQRRFNDSRVPVYTELILGLPGESYASWVAGIDRVLASGLRNQLFMYVCQVFPNTELDDPDYRARFGIRTRSIELTEIHGTVRAPGEPGEVEEIVVGTDSMSTEDWQRALVLSWLTMLVHSLKLGYFVLAWLVDRFGIRHSDFLEWLAGGGIDEDEYPVLAREIATLRTKTERLLAGEGRGCVLPEHGAIYWDEEEASFLRLSRDFDGFFDELHDATGAFLRARRIVYDASELDEIMRYQRLRIPRPSGVVVDRVPFERNVHDYLEALGTSRPVELERDSHVLAARQPDFAGDLPRFARETILWGRKSGTMLVEVERVQAGSGRAVGV